MPFFFCLGGLGGVKGVKGGFRGVKGVINTRIIAVSFGAVIVDTKLRQTVNAGFVDKYP